MHCDVCHCSTGLTWQRPFIDRWEVRWHLQVLLSLSQSVYFLTCLLSSHYAASLCVLSLHAPLWQRCFSAVSLLRSTTSCFLSISLCCFSLCPVTPCSTLATLFFCRLIALLHCVRFWAHFAPCSASTMRFRMCRINGGHIMN